MDIFSKKKRSEIMSRIRSRDSKMEVSLRKQLWKKGFRYLKNSSKYFGKPDIVLPKYEVAVFVDSCFWHGCARHGTLPSTRRSFWSQKIKRNRTRDKVVNRHYKNLGWRIIRIWEHEIKTNTGRVVAKSIRSFK